MVIEAPSKINLHLRIRGRREDGYHDLESLFLALSFGDTLFVDLISGTGRTELVMDASIPSGENLINRAVSVFREYTGFDRSVRIRVEKRIPMGAGLGGGSSDAAAVLLAMDRLCGGDRNSAAMPDMALSLGSDVPFFLGSPAAFVEGRGERIRPLEAPPGIWVVLVKPDFSSSTAEAFRLWDRMDRGKVLRNGTPGPEALISALYKDPGLWPFGNDFLDIFLEHGPLEERGVYREILKDLSSRGAAFSGLSGSGSTCFGIFSDKGVAERAEKELSSRWNFVRLAFPLARSGNTVVQLL